MKRPAQVTLLLVLMALGLALGFYSWKQPRADAHRYQMLSTWGLGHYLGQRYPGGRVMILSNPFVRRAKTASSIVDQEESRIDGLKKGLSPHIQSVRVVHPALKPDALERPQAFILDANATTPLSFLSSHPAPLTI